MKKYLFIAATFLCSAFCHAQEAGCFKGNDLSDMELESNADFSSYNTFFVGEFHGIYSTSEIKLALIKYVNTHYAVTDVFMEIGFSTAWLYNRYLATGDTTFFTNPVLTYAAKKVNRDFWKQLYAYNKTAAHKIIIHGMDFERKDFVKVMKLLMPPGKEKPKEIITSLTYIDTATAVVVNLPTFVDNATKQRLRNDSSVTIYETIKNDVMSHRAVYEHYYGADFKVVEDIMLNKDTYNSQRNKTMYDNVTKQVKRDDIKKFIVFSGLMHGDMSYKGWHSLCNRLAKKYKLVNIAMTCRNCYDSQAQHQPAAFYRGPATYDKDTVLISSIYEKYFNSGCKYTLIPTDEVNDKRVKKFSNYIILSKDQPVFKQNPARP